MCYYISNYGHGCGRGVVPATHPDAVLRYGAKDALVKLADTEVGLLDTYAYYDKPSLKVGFTKVRKHFIMLFVAKM